MLSIIVVICAKDTSQCKKNTQSNNKTKSLITVNIWDPDVYELGTLVVDATVKGGISAQMDAFRSGFNEVCSVFLTFSI